MLTFLASAAYACGVYTLQDHRTDEEIRVYAASVRKHIDGRTTRWFPLRADDPADLYVDAADGSRILDVKESLLLHRDEPIGTVKSDAITVAGTTYKVGLEPGEASRTLEGRKTLTVAVHEGEKPVLTGVAQPWGCFGPDDRGLEHERSDVLQRVAFILAWPTLKAE